LVTTLQLAGKVAVVTGASAGIGQAAAIALANEGVTVVASARRAERLEELAAAHARIVARPADVTDPGQVEALAHWVADEFGACHILVNNAGASFGSRLRGPDDLDDFQRTMDLNVMGPVRCMAAFAELMFASAPGRVINVASVAGKVGVGPVAYVASKFALVGLSEAAGWDWRRKGVTVSQLNPGFIRTEQFPQDDLMRSPFGRLIVSTPEAAAAAIVDVARSGHPERTVPRWYRVAPVVRHLAAPVYWAAGSRGGTRY
jgi:NAD(P)-dependent dehydrogenase (short-subunit alcohol dehydrogenase family)